MRNKLLFSVFLYIFLSSDAYSEKILKTNNTMGSIVSNEDSLQNSVISKENNSVENHKPSQTIKKIESLNIFNNSSNQTTISGKSLQDTFLLEIDYLREQIFLTERKIGLLEQLRTYYLENNMTIPVFSL